MSEPKDITLFVLTEEGQRIPPIEGDVPCDNYEPSGPGAGVEPDGHPQCAQCGFSKSEHREADTPPVNVCENCKGTGYYGDHGPGIKGNFEYQPCECGARPNIATLEPSESFAQIFAAAEKTVGYWKERLALEQAEIARLKEERRALHAELQEFKDGNENLSNILAKLQSAKQSAKNSKASFRQMKQERDTLSAAYGEALTTIKSHNESIARLEAQLVAVIAQLAEARDAATWMICDPESKYGPTAKAFLQALRCNGNNVYDDLRKQLAAVTADRDKLLAACELAYEAMSDHYDGAEDSKNLWMGESMQALESASARPKGAA